MRCENANCEAKLDGDGAHADLDSLGLEVTLKNVDGDTAELDLARLAGAPDETVKLTERQSADALGATVTLLKVDGSAVIVRLTPER